MVSRKTLVSVFAATLLIGVAATRAGASLPAMVDKWQGGDVRKFADSDLATLVANDAPVYREYGFVGAMRREYAQGAQKFTATLWQLKDASGSLGLFTFLARTGMTAGKVGEDIVASSDSSYFVWRKAYILEASGAELDEDEIIALAAEIPATEEQSAILPTLPSFFPVENIVPLSRKYALGPAALGRALSDVPVEKLAMESGTEAAIARYQLGGQTTTMLLLLYPTPQLAAKKFTEFLELPEVASGGTANSENLIQRKGSLVGFVFGAPSKVEATRLLERVDYETTLMWNEFVEPRGQNVGTLILAVFALAGTVIAFALVAGIAFGGFRIFAKKYIPYPIFDRPSQSEIVRLDLDEK